MIGVLAGLESVGLLGLSVLFPIVAMIIASCRRMPSDQTVRSTAPALGSIDILIPAHNEAEHIESTLKSLVDAISYLKNLQPTALLPSLSVHVGADTCTDRTVAVAARFPDVRVTEVRHTNKWKTLKDLCLQSSADWIFFVDVGTLWPKNFLSEALGRLQSDPRVLALAPAYRPLRAGGVHTVLWSIETFLKRLEARSGGPISVHGATVAYDAGKLNEVFQLLGDIPWFNDDVAIPLTLRALYPHGRILYPAGTVSDNGIEGRKLDFGRRRRMVVGNCQWIRGLWLRCLRRNPVAGTVALRRMFRLGWAYWLGLGLVLLFLKIPALALPTLLILALLLAVSGAVRQLAGAAGASLLAPFYLLSPETASLSWE